MYSDPSAVDDATKGLLHAVFARKACVAWLPRDANGSRSGWFRLGVTVLAPSGKIS